jgi:hypothetical protein
MVDFRLDGNDYDQRAPAGALARANAGRRKTRIEMMEELDRLGAPYKKRATWSELAALLSEEAQAPREELPPPFYDEGTGTYRKKPLPLPFGRDRSDLRSRSRMLPPEWAEKIGEAAQLRKEEMSVLRGVVASRSFPQRTVNTLTKIAEGPVSQATARAIYEKLAPRNVPSWEQQKAARFYTSTASVAVGAPDIQLPAKRVMGVLDPSAIVTGRVGMATGGSADRTPPRSMSIMGLLSEVEERSAQLGRRWDVSTAAVFERDSDNRVVLSRNGEPSVIGGYYAQFPESERLGRFKAYLVEELERLRRLVDTRASLATAARFYGSPSESDIGQFGERGSVPASVSAAGVGIFTRPDPPRLGEHGSRCGNAIDGTAYYVVVPHRTRTIGGFFTWEAVYNQALETKGYAETPVPRELEDRVAEWTFSVERGGASRDSQLLGSPQRPGHLIQAIEASYAGMDPKLRQIAKDLTYVGQVSKEGAEAGLYRLRDDGKLQAMGVATATLPAGNYYLYVPTVATLLGLGEAGRRLLQNKRDSGFRVSEKSREYLSEVFAGERAIGAGQIVGMKKGAKARRMRRGPKNEELATTSKAGASGAWAQPGINFCWWAEGEEEGNVLTYPAYYRRKASSLEQFKKFRPFGGERTQDWQEWTAMRPYASAKEALRELSAKDGTPVSSAVADMLFASNLVYVRRGAATMYEDMGLEKPEKYTLVGPDYEVEETERIGIWAHDKGSSPYFSWVRDIVAARPGETENAYGQKVPRCMSPAEKLALRWMRSVIEAARTLENALGGEIRGSATGLRAIVDGLRYAPATLAGSKLGERVNKVLKRLGAAAAELANSAAAIQRGLTNQGSAVERKAAEIASAYLLYKEDSESPIFGYALVRERIRIAYDEETGEEKAQIVYTPEEESILGRFVAQAEYIGLIGLLDPASYRAGYVSNVKSREQRSVFFSRLEKMFLVPDRVGASALAFLLKKAKADPLPALSRALGIRTTPDRRVAVTHPLTDIAEMAAREGYFEPYAQALAGMGDRGTARDAALSRAAQEIRRATVLGDWTALRPDSVSSGSTGELAKAWGYSIGRVLAGNPRKETRLALLSLLMNDVYLGRQRDGTISTSGSGRYGQGRGFTPSFDPGLTEALLLIEFFYAIGADKLVGDLYADSGAVLPILSTMATKLEAQVAAQLGDKPLGSLSEEGYSIYKTYNPYLFEMVRMFWVTKSAETTGSSWRGFLADASNLVRADALGRYGTALEIAQNEVVTGSDDLPLDGEDGKLGLLLLSPLFAFEDAFESVRGGSLRQEQEMLTFREFTPSVLKAGAAEMGFGGPRAVARFARALNDALAAYYRLWPVGESQKTARRILEDFVERPQATLQALRDNVRIAVPRLSSLRQGLTSTESRWLLGEPPVQATLGGEALNVPTQDPSVEQERALVRLRGVLAQAVGVGEGLYPRLSDRALLLRGMDPEARAEVEASLLATFQEAEIPVRERSAETGDMRKVWLPSLPVTGAYDKPTIVKLLRYEHSLVRPPGLQVKGGMTAVPWVLRKGSPPDPSKSVGRMGDDIYSASTLVRLGQEEEARRFEAKKDLLPPWIARIDSLIGELAARLGFRLDYTDIAKSVRAPAPEARRVQAAASPGGDSYVQGARIRELVGRVKADLDEFGYPKK